MNASNDSLQTLQPSTAQLDVSLYRLGVSLYLLHHPTGDVRHYRPQVKRWDRSSVSYQAFIQHYPEYRVMYEDLTEPELLLVLEWIYESPDGKTGSTLNS